MSKVVPNSNSNIAVAVVAGAVAAVAGRFVWKRFKNRKASK
jgi:hypothetical protein